MNEIPSVFDLPRGIRWPAVRDCDAGRWVSRGSLVLDVRRGVPRLARWEP